MQSMVVEIPVEGDWPSAEDMKARNAVIDELDKARFGEFIGSGGGMGTMDFQYDVADPGQAKELLAVVMQKHMAGRKYSVRLSERVTNSENESNEPFPGSRTYVHKKCGQVTEVDGEDFRNLAAPVPGMKGTMCTACRGYFPISEFQWADSNEEIVAYYARHRERVPALTRLLCSRPFGIGVILLGFMAGIGLGVWSGYALGLVWGLLIGVLASLVGAIATLIIWDGIEQRLLSSALEVPDVRCLK